jgi:hypothetical protein
MILYLDKVKSLIYRRLEGIRFMELQTCRFLLADDFFQTLNQSCALGVYPRSARVKRGKWWCSSAAVRLRRQTSDLPQSQTTSSSVFRRSPRPLPPPPNACPETSSPVILSVSIPTVLRRWGQLPTFPVDGRAR